MRAVRDETGAVGGLEGLAFGVAIFVFGLLLVMSTWRVIDTKLAVASAAREAVRSYVETPVGEDPLFSARAAAASVVAGYGMDSDAAGFDVRTVGPDGATAPAAFERCAIVSIEVRYPVELSLPFANRIAPVTASTTASEVLDPLRSGLEGEAACVGA